MFKLEGEILYCELPQGKNQDQLIEDCKSEIKGLVNTGSLYGKDIKINGRLTTGMALSLGHELAHICKSVSIFDPKMNDYVLCFKH